MSGAQWGAILAPVFWGAVIVAIVAGVRWLRKRK